MKRILESFWFFGANNVHVIGHGRNAVDRVDRYFTTETMTEAYFTLDESVLAATRRNVR